MELYCYECNQKFLRILTDLPADAFGDIASATQYDPLITSNASLQSSTTISGVANLVGHVPPLMYHNASPGFSGFPNPIPPSELRYTLTGLESHALEPSVIRDELDTGFQERNDVSTNSFLCQGPQSVPERDGVPGNASFYATGLDHLNSTSITESDAMFTDAVETQRNTLLTDAAGLQEYGANPNIPCESDSPDDAIAADAAPSNSGTDYCLCRLNCGRRYKSAKIMERHVFEYHEGGHKLHCTHVGCIFNLEKTFPRKESLNKHNARYSATAKPRE